MSHRLDRRRFLQTAGLLLVAPAISLSGCARPRFTSDPFTLGVASGAPLPDGIVLWTRLAPDPLAGGGLDPQPIPVHWEVAADDAFRDIVRRGVANADPRYAHSVHVEVNALRPDRWYWYRFMVGDAVSPTGRTRTAPAPDALGRWRFAFASCQQYEQGYYSAHRHLAQEDLDLVVFLGDYVYESSWGRNHVRKHEAPEPRTLEQYRNRHAHYKTDPDLQRSHAQFPWIVTWDDHEVSNDYANDRSQDLDPDFLSRRTAAYQAYYEHMPLRTDARPQRTQLRLYQAYDFGRLARFHVLDGRQYRSYQPCPKAGRGGGTIVTRENCPERLESQQTMLGRQQEQWLADSLEKSNARWNIIAQQTLMAQLTRNVDPAPQWWTDSWDGYPAARQRLLTQLAARKPANPVVISGDAHTNFVCDLKTDFDDAQAPVVATEFCGTSISSQGPALKETDAWRTNNPHIKFARGDRRGYVTVALDGQRARVRLRVIKNEKLESSPIATQAAFVVEDGRAGAESD